MDYGHWDISVVGFFDPLSWFGFVYLATNATSGRRYIGKKNFGIVRRKKVKGRVNRRIIHSESNWRTYTTSSREINEEIKLGQQFYFQILSLHTTKGSLSYAEIETQIFNDVLRSGLYYNNAIGTTKYIPVIETSPKSQIRIL